MLKTKNCIVSKQTAPTNLTETILVWFGLIQSLFWKSTKPKVKPHFFFITWFIWLLASKLNQTALWTPLVIIMYQNFKVWNIIGPSNI